MLNNYYQKHKEKLQKKSIWKIWKSFWRRDRIWKKIQERYQNFTEENEKKVSGTQEEATLLLNKLLFNT